MKFKPNSQLQAAIALALTGSIMLSGCSDSNSSTTSAVNLFTINATGGTGGSDSGGRGGNGGELEIEKDGIGDIIISNELEYNDSGFIDESKFSAANIANMGNLGTNPLTIAVDTTIEVLADGAARPAADTPHMRDGGDRNIYISDGVGTVDGTQDPVTGIEVASGVTLTLGLNYTGATDIRLQNDFVNRGAVTTAPYTAANRGDLNIDSSSYIGSGTINLAGVENGQNGGDVYIQTNYNLYNQGSMITNGNAATGAINAGSAGDIEFDAGYTMQNTGDLSATGGGAEDGSGGSGGQITMYGGWGSGLNSGTLDTHGGDGTTIGGSGAQIYIGSEETGKTLNMGNLMTYGGNATDGSAGSGGNVYMYSEGNIIASSGDISTYGGNSTFTSGNAGNAGNINLEAEYDNFYNASDESPTGEVWIKGNLDLHGGNALTSTSDSGDGGYGGDIYLYSYSDDQPQYPRHIKMLGYASMDASAGDGYAGGDANGIYAYADEEHADNNMEFAGGNVINKIDLTATGGDVTADPVTTSVSEAGSGGYLDLETAYSHGAALPDSFMTMNSGDSDLSGGLNGLNNSSTSDARGGSVYLWGYNGSTNTGTHVANGGNDSARDDTTDNGNGGYGGYLEVVSETGTAKNTGAFTGNGGEAEEFGGNGGYVGIYGAEAINSGDLTVNGGNSVGTVGTSTDGGDGGYIELYTIDS